MRVRVQFFAALREEVGQERLDLDVEAAATPEDVWRQLVGDHPRIANRRQSLSAAVNRRYASFSSALAEGDEIVFIPPVSGG